MLLAWEQGCGKTVIALAAAEKLFQLQKASTALVLAQPSNAWQWADSIERFTDSNAILAEAKIKSSRLYKPERGRPYYVVPWSLFRNDFDTLVKYPWDIVIADEAQEFRNFKTVTSKRMKRLNVVAKPTYRWALTGTAISNKLEELYNIMYWVDSKFLPPWPAFAKEHIEFNQFQQPYKYKNLQGLNKHLVKRMDRKTHADQQGKMPKILPPVIHKIEPHAAYIKAEKHLLGTLDNMVAHLAFDDEGNLTGQQDPKVSKAFHQVREELASPAKLQYALQLAAGILAEHGDNRVVFFSHYKQPLYELSLGFGNQAVLFTGDQNSAEKRANTKAFLGEGGPRVLLCSNAGAAGLDLYSANWLINIDVPPSWGILDQRIKRITRLSSIHPSANIAFLILDKSIEEFFYRTVTNKGRLASGALEGTENEVVIRPESLRAFLGRSDGSVLPAVEAKKAVRSPSRKTKPAAKGSNRRAPRKASSAKRNPRT